jgi:hypothetical protein
MNWWGRLAGLSLLLLVVLFSCEEDVSTIGIKRPNPKFKVTYAEVNIPSSVVLFKDIITYNNVNSNQSIEDGDQRLLVGQYTDDRFGKIRTETYTQIGPPVLNAPISSATVYDSLVLQLKTDFYHYGSSAISAERIVVHELLDTLNNGNYFSSTPLAYDPTPIGAVSFTVNPEDYDQAITDNNDNVTTNNRVTTFRMVLGGNLGLYLYETVKSETDIKSDYVKFSGLHKGLAIVPDGSGNKVIGINPITPTTTGIPGATDTKLILYYTEGVTQKSVDFPLYPNVNPYTAAKNPVVGYTSIIADRSGTSLGGLTETHKDYYPVDDKRMTESGIGMLTKLDFTEYFKYMDTVSNAVLNSAELVIEGEQSEFSFPPQFQLRAMTDKNYFQEYAQDTVINGVASKIVDTETVLIYGSSSAATINQFTGFIDINGDDQQIVYPSANQSFVISSYLTQFFQVQYGARNSAKRMNYVALLPRISHFYKSVNRCVLNNNIKLKLYYTSAIPEKK